MDTSSMGANKVQGIGSGIVGDVKKWDEVTTDEKIERLRQQLQNNQYVYRRLAEMEAEIFKLKQHSHSENGSVVVPISSTNALGASLAQSYNILA